MIKLVSTKDALTGACVLTFPLATLASLLVVNATTAATGAAAGIVLAGASWIVLTTWRNAQSTENISHVLNRAEAHRPERG